MLVANHSVDRWVGGFVAWLAWKASFLDRPAIGEETQTGRGSLRRSCMMNGRLSAMVVLLAVTFFCNHAVLAVEKPVPVSMSAEEFSRLSVADQNTLLLRVFQRRLEHARNIHYDVEEFVKGYENHDGEPGRPVGGKGVRVLFRNWRLGNSYRMDANKYGKPDDVGFFSCVTSGFDADEGVGRSTARINGKQPAVGRIDSQQDTATRDNDYNYWLDGDYPSWQEYLFRYILSRKSEFEIKSPVEGNEVQLTVAYQPAWAKKPGGERVFLLDPKKGFLPVRGTSRWEEVRKEGKRSWRVEKFTVEESRLVGDVWMPIKLKLMISASTLPDAISVNEMKVSQIEYGNVTPSDLTVVFTKGMQIVDAVKGVAYIADANGDPAGPVQPLGMPAGLPTPVPERQSRVVMFSLLGILAVSSVGLLLLRRWRKKSRLNLSARVG
jgi:hypothetical protein